MIHTLKSCFRADVKTVAFLKNMNPKITISLNLKLWMRLEDKLNYVINLDNNLVFCCFL